MITTHFPLLYTIKRLSLVFTPSGAPLLLGSIRSISCEHLPIVAYASVQNPLLLQSTLSDLKNSLLQSGYPRGVIKYTVNDVLHKRKDRPSQPTLTVPKAPAQRLQHANATCRNIVGRNMLRAFGHRVAMCCDMLGVVGSIKFY